MATTQISIPFVSIDCNLDPNMLFEHIKNLWPAISVGNYVLFYNLTDASRHVMYEWLDNIPSHYEQIDNGITFCTIRKVK